MLKFKDTVLCISLMEERMYIHGYFYVNVYRYAFTQMLHVFQNQRNENKSEPGPGHCPGDPVLCLTTRRFL